MKNQILNAFIGIKMILICLATHQPVELNNTKAVHIEIAETMFDAGQKLTINVYHHGSCGYKGTGIFKPLDASIYLKRGKEEIDSGFSNSLGTKTFQGLDAGPYTVVVRRLGFHTKVKSFKLNSDKTLSFGMHPGRS